MADIAKEQADLAKADKDIEEGEARIGHQLALIEELRRDGHDTDDAEKLLGALQQSLETWKSHRELIQAVLKRNRERQGGGGP